MRCKIRYVSRQRSGNVSHSDQRFNLDGRRISLGRGTDCHVFLKDLRASYHHAEIVVRDFDVVIEAVERSALTVDGAPVERAVVTPDSEIEVGPYRLQLLPAEPDADLALTVELTSPPQTDTVEKLLEPRRTQLGSGLLRKRALSWGLFLLLIALGLALPIIAHRSLAPDGTRPAASGPEPMHDGSLFAGLDQIWISGDLSSSHRLLSNQCGACHQAPFELVTEQACAACHRDTQHHFDTARFTFAGFDPIECMDCHAEHQGPAGVVPAHQSLCADCHRDLSGHEPAPELLDATDFGDPDGHPEFRPSVIVDPDGTQIARVALGAPDFPKEMSNLRFPHDIHLAQVCEAPASGQDVPLEMRQKCDVLRMARQRMNREGLDCGDCHRPEPGGVNMLPVRMQDHCAVCHRLEFDANAPTRVLPHGEPEVVIAMINDYYVARVALDQPLTLEIPAGIRQRPGEAARQPPQAQPVAPNPLAGAAQVAAQKLDVVFGRSLCGVCHEILTPAASANDQWEVLPVKVAALWMPKAMFNHAAHQTTPCTACHHARESKLSSDVLMPVIAECRVCHQGEHATTALPSTCIMCHVYHRDGLPPMLPLAAEAADAPR